MVLTAIITLPVSANDVGDTFKVTTKSYNDVFNGNSDQYKGKTVILQSNDVHGQIDSYTYMRTLAKDYTNAGAEVITVDSGDFSQGSPYVIMSKGKSAISLMNEAGYDYATIGNRDFDFGIDQLLKNLSNAKFKVLCANALKDGEAIFEGNDVYTTKSGLKIGIFGLITPETSSKAKPSLINGITFFNNANSKTELYDCANAQIVNLQEKGAEIIVGIFHLGMNQESSADGHRSLDVYKNVSGIDFVLDGHSHDMMTEGPSNEPIQSTGTRFDNIGVVVIDDTSKKVVDNYLIDTEGIKEDPSVSDRAQKTILQVDDEYGATIGISKVKFASEKKENRCYETNTGDIITDALTWEIMKDDTNLQVPKDNVVTIINGGSIKTGLGMGFVSKKNIQTALPYENTLCVSYVTGKDLLETLEASTFQIPTPMGGYPQTKGIKFTIDTTKPYDNGELYPGATYYAPKTINRVTIDSINGKPFDESATYAIITNDFVADGGDTYYAIKAAESKSNNSYDTGMNIDEIVSSYIKDELHGIISARKYGKSRGDVTIIPTPEDTTSTPLEQVLNQLTIIFCDMSLW